MATPTDVRDVLTGWVHRCGPSFLDEPRRVRAVLHDAVPDSPHQTALLTAALEDGVSRRIRGTPPDRLAGELDRMTAELAGRRGLAQSDAAWAVSAVAAALGVPDPPPGSDRSGEFRQQRRGRQGLLITALVAAAVLVVGGIVAAVLFLNRGPAPPGGVRVDAQEEGVALRWDAAGDGVRYEVLRDGEPVAETAEIEYVDTDVEGGTEYSYSVRTVEGSGERSEPSASEAVAAALTRPMIRPPTTDGLAVTLSWEPVAGAEHYEVSRGGSTVGDNVTDTTFTDPEAQVGRLTYTVTAVDDDGEGGRSSAGVTAIVAPWGTMQPIASALPELFPVTPDDSLPEPVAPHTCQYTEPGGSNESIERVQCSFDNGVVVEIDRFESPEQVADDFRNWNFGPPQVVDTWYCSGPTMGQFTEWMTMDGKPFELMTFVAPELALFDVLASWSPDHTVEELNTAFFQSGILCP